MKGVQMSRLFAFSLVAVVTVPDTGVGGYTEVPCVIFTTDELTCFLINSLSEFNQWPHFTNFTFADVQIQDLFADIIIQGAVLLALAAQTLIEKGREFSITDNGVTYQPPQVSDILKLLGINNKIFLRKLKPNEHQLYVLRILRKEALKYLNLIGFSNKRFISDAIILAR